jgi:hypothetical protein
MTFLLRSSAAGYGGGYGFRSCFGNGRSGFRNRGGNFGYRASETASVTSFAEKSDARFCSSFMDSVSPGINQKDNNTEECNHGKHNARSLNDGFAVGPYDLFLSFTAKSLIKVRFFFGAGAAIPLPLPDFFCFVCLFGFCHFFGGLGLFFLSHADSSR